MKKEGYRTGLVSVSFRGHTPMEILEAMKSSGLGFVEWGSDVHAPCEEPDKLIEIAKMQEEYGIECSSYGTYFRIGETPMEELEKYIDAAKILGTNILRLWCGRKNGADMTESEKNELLELCRQGAKIAEARGVTLCLECHKKTFTENPKDAVWLMNSVDSPSFRMYWQPFQWQSAEENVKNAETIAPYAENIHVFNWKDDKKLPLAAAVDEWREYLSRFSGSQAVLLEFMPDGTLGELKAEADALKTIVGESL